MLLLAWGPAKPQAIVSKINCKMYGMSNVVIFLIKYIYPKIYLWNKKNILDEKYIFIFNKIIWFKIYGLNYLFMINIMRNWSLFVTAQSLDRSTNIAAPILPKYFHDLPKVNGDKGFK